MDPYLEHPALWPDVHNSLVAAVRDALSPVLRPKYYLALESRTYAFRQDDLVLIGLPDLAVITRRERPSTPSAGEERVAVLDVEVPIRDEIEETFLEVRDTASGRVVTVIELLSPANKIHPRGREAYEAKREDILRTRTSLVEADLLRSGEPMPVYAKEPIEGDYRILVTRGSRRPRGQLYAFGLRHAIPSFRLPLLEGDEEADLELGRILHELYERASFDLRLDYAHPAVPPLSAEDAAWAAERVRQASRP